MDNARPLRLVVLTENQDLGPAARLIDRLGQIDSVEVSALIVEQFRAPFRNRLRRVYKRSGFTGAVHYIGTKFCDKAFALCDRLSARALHCLVPLDPPTAEPVVSCPIEYVGNHNSDQTVEMIRDRYEADLGIVYGARILKPTTVDAARRGMLNIHKRKLPEYRGGGPIGLWEMLNGEDSITVSIHWVGDRVDEGDLVAEESILIEENDNLESLGLKADFVGERLFCRAIRQVADGSAKSTPQSQLSASREPKTYLAPIGWNRYRLKRLAESGRRPAKSAIRRTYELVSLVRWLAFLMLKGVAIRLRRGGFQENAPVVVLYYHLVSSRRHPMAISADRLHRQLRFLKNFFQFVDLDSAVHTVRSGRNVQPMIALTFDDGYRENMIDTRAVCEDLSIPICHFVCSSLVGSEESFHHDGDAGRGFVPFSVGELRQLAADPLVTIGCHTATHFDCGSTDDRSVLSREIVDSKRELTEITELTIKHFSFPWGTPANFNDVSLGVLASAEYEAAFSAYGGINEPRVDHSKLVLKRLPTLYGDSRNDLLCLLGECLGYSRWVPWRPEPSVPNRDVTGVTR